MEEGSKNVLSWCWEFLSYPYLFCIAYGYCAYDGSFILIWDGSRGYGTSRCIRPDFVTYVGGVIHI